MAPISLPPASQRPLTSVLSLDQHGSWKRTLAKAIDLLGLPPYPSHFPNQTWAQYRLEVEQRTVVPDPRIEYTSRWLLGKLEPNGTEATKETKDARTWYLLSKVLPKCSSAAIARLLETHSLARILESTLLWLRDELVARLEDVKSESEEDVAKGVFKPSTSTHAALRYQYVGLVGRILGLLLHIQREETSNVFEASHRRHITQAMKAEPSQLALSLGYVFYICNQILQANASGTVRSVTELSTTTFLPLFIDMFELQYKWSNESTKAAIDDAFISSTAVPSLQLLDTCQHWTVSQFQDEVKELSARLRTLLSVHTIRPIRTKLTSANNSTGLKVFDSLTRSLSARPLCSTARMHNWRALDQTTAYLQTSFLSQLYELAIESCQKRSSKVGQADVPWLESLFVKLSGIAGILLPPESALDAQNCHKRLLTRMLDAALKARVTLSVSLLQSILGKHSGILEVGLKNSAGKYLVNKCLSVDADVFVLPSKSSVPSSYDHKPPNRYLKRLLAELKKYESLDDEEKGQIRDLVLLPLLDGFIRARDLSDFLGFWQEQLDKLEVRRNNIGASYGTQPLPGLWEDEALLNAVISSVDKLTISQIKKVIATLSDDNTLPPSPPSRPKMTTLSNFVILYSVYRGISGHDRLERLADLAHSTFVSLQAKLNKPEQSPSSLRWRYWRIMTAIIQQWPSFADVGLSTVVEEALNVIKRAPSWTETQDGQREDLTPIYHAFCFIASSHTHDGVRDYPATECGGPLNMAFEMIVRTMEPFHLRVQHDMFETFRPLMSHPNSFTSLVHISSVEQLYLGCMYTVVCSYGLFSRIDPKLQSIFIDQAYTCALQQRRVKAPCQPNVISFGWLWQYLLKTSVLSNDSVPQESLRAFLTTRYVSSSQFNDPKCWSIRSADYTLAFEAINTLQADDLGRNERASVSNGVLNILTHALIPERCYIVSHLYLQEKMISQPSKLMCLLNNLELPSGSVGAPKYRERSALLEIVQKIDDFESTPSGALVWAIPLRRLCRSVVKYLISTAVEQQDSLQHLRILYDELIRALESHFNDKSNCPLAFSVAAAVILTLFHDNEHQVSAILQLDTSALQRPRQYHLEVLLRAARRLFQTAESLPFYQQEGPSHKMLQVLDDLCPYADLIRLHPTLGYEDEIFAKFQHLATPRHNHFVEPFVERPSAKELERIDRLALRVARLNLQISAGDDGLITVLAQCSSMLDQKTKEEFQSDPNMTGNQQLPPFCNPEEIVSYMQEAVFSMTPTQKVNALRMTYGHLGKRRSKIGDLRLVEMIITSINDDDVSELQSTAARCCISMSRMLWETESDLRLCIRPTQCITALMQKQPRMVKQSQVDALISGIAVAAHSVEMRQTLGQSGKVFTILCELFTTVLRSHRSKIGGRYNLIVPALQGLLRCLFRPYARASTESETEFALTDVHAAEYARILTMLCDPTVSAVTKSRRRLHAGLNDETKKARSIAGQHLPALVMEYCRCQLSGKTAPDMGAALQVGLWAILQVMTQDRIKAMNAAMDSTSRSVFRSLYDDFRKSGRWSGG